MIYPWHKAAWQHFCEQKQKTRLPHAVIITGVDGLGKQALANEMVSALLCSHHDGLGEPCGDCQSCQLFQAGNHPDHTLVAPIDTSKYIQIEQIRQLKDKQMLTPNIADWKTVIISPADRMNAYASNSLLKLLEEPQKNTLLLLVSHNSDQLPITILSRCRRVEIVAPDKDVAINWLQKQHINQDAIGALLPLARGAPPKVLAMIEADMLSTMQQIDSDFTLLLQRRAHPIAMAKNWQRYDMITVLHYLQLLIKERLIAIKQSNPDDNKRYWHIYDCIVATIKLISSPNNINQTWLVEQFMVSIIE